MLVSGVIGLSKIFWLVCDSTGALFSIGVVKNDDDPSTTGVSVWFVEIVCVAWASLNACLATDVTANFFASPTLNVLSPKGR